MAQVQKRTWVYTDVHQTHFKGFYHVETRARHEETQMSLQWYWNGPLIGIGINTQSVFISGRSGLANSESTETYLRQCSCTFMVTQNTAQWTLSSLMDVLPVEAGKWRPALWLSSQTFAGYVATAFLSPLAIVMPLPPSPTTPWVAVANAFSRHRTLSNCRTLNKHVSCQVIFPQPCAESES